jgi:hypothetical protein
VAREPACFAYNLPAVTKNHVRLARDVAVADSLVFVVVGNVEVLILRQAP